MAALEKGTILENTYEIIEEIGSGGGGIVFKARHLRLQTDVVVKKIKDEVQGKVKSRQEADILKRLKHPFLPRVYDFIETEDGVYTVMDFIQGEDLDEAVKKHGKYPQKQVKKWAEQLGEALAYLHGQKQPIIHSDIKPANIMLTGEGNVCLIDFNISLAMGGTMESAVGISAGFSPPEQYRDPALYARMTHNYTLQNSLRMAKGEDDRTETLPREAEDDTTEVLPREAEDDRTETLPREMEDDTTELLSQEEDDTTETLPRESWQRRDKTSALSGSNVPGYTKFIGRGIDARSDIYSLGVTLYYVLTGVKPSYDFEQRIPVGETGVYVSEGFALILEKMMALSPDARYQNGEEFLKAIRNCYKLDRRYKVMHRRQTGIQLAALACLAAGMLVTAGGIYKMRADRNSAYYELIQQAESAISRYGFDEAGALLVNAKALIETRVEAYENEVYLLYLNGNYDECISLGENYINTTPFLLETEEDEERFGNIFYIVGNAYFEKEDYPNAKNLFEYAIEYNNKNGLYYRDYAITLAKMGQIEAAKTQLERGIEMGIAQDSIYMAQGEIAHVKGLYEEAAEYLTQTITTTADEQMKKRAILLCVSAYKAMGGDAVNREITLLEQNKDQFAGSGNLVMTEYLADAYARKAQMDDAEEYYQKALDLFQVIYDDGYVTYQLQQNMAILYESMDRFDEAESLLLQMAEEYPERYEVYKRLAYLEADVQQTKENADRDYVQMQLYYERALEKYSGKEQDLEMDMLDGMMQELKDGGWIE
ncbi:MAG: protein kinase [Candidatus Gastranaerophilales bacterium]|nr:protein kinase [Candidatus Gastranaerophilales bacterium]